MATLEQLVPYLESGSFGRNDIIKIVANGDLPLPLKMLANVSMTTITENQVKDVQKNVARYLRLLIDGETEEIVSLINGYLGN